MLCNNCGKKIEYGSDEACVYDDEIYCCDGCMLSHLDYELPDYSDFTKEEFDSCDYWYGTYNDGSNLYYATHSLKVPPKSLENKQ
jgi:hypothetical protein